MTVRSQTTEAESVFVRKERKVREKKQGVFISLRPWRPSRTNAFAFGFQRLKAKSVFVRKERKVREKKQGIFISLRPWRPSRTNAFVVIGNSR